METSHGLNPFLQIVGGKPDELREIRGVDFHIGRLPNLDLFIGDGRVSRPHARIHLRPDGRYELVDLKSQNGTYLNGKKLTPDQPRVLHDGDLIKIVEQELVFHHASPTTEDDESKLTTVIRSMDDFSSDLLVQRSNQPATTLVAVLDVVRALGGGGDLSEILGRALDGLLAVFPVASRAFIATLEQDDSLLLAAFRGREPGEHPPVISRLIRDRIVEGQAVLIKDIVFDQVNTSRSLTSSIRSAVCVPLRSHEGKPVGMVQLDRQTDKNLFKEEDLELLAVISLPIGVAMENHQLLQERATWTAARTIQRALLPRNQPCVPGMRFWECYRPSHEVGGDLYEYVAVEAGGAAADSPQPWAVALGDVAGKGMPAALISASIRPELRVLARSGMGPGEVLGRVNRLLFDQEIDGRFVTLLLGVIDPLTSELTLVNAGHPPALLRRACGTVEKLICPGTGPPLGVDRDATYEPHALPLQPGDTVVFYSDGVLDAIDKQKNMFGMDGLLRALATAPHGASAVGEAIFAAVRSHAASRSQFDDITLVCFGREGE